jgi:hypothetical protein
MRQNINEQILRCCCERQVDHYAVIVDAETQ